MLLILYTLSRQTYGFNELQSSLKLNTATLTKRLKELENHKLVSKQVEGLNTFYSLTEKGTKLSKLIDSISNI